MAKIKKWAKDNFHTLERAVRDGNACILDARDKATGKPAVLVCAAQPEDNGEITLVPFAVMINGNPYEMYDPPAPTGGYKK